MCVRVHVCVYMYILTVECELAACESTVHVQSCDQGTPGGN